MIKKFLYILVFLCAAMASAKTIPANIAEQYNYLKLRNAELENTVGPEKKPWYIILKDGNLSDLKELLKAVNTDYGHLSIKSEILDIDEDQAKSINDYLTQINAKSALALYVALEDGKPIVVPIGMSAGVYNEEEIQAYYAQYLDTVSVDGYDAEIIKEQISYSFKHDNLLLETYAGKLNQGKPYEILMVESLAMLKSKTQDWAVIKSFSYKNYGEKEIGITRLRTALDSITNAYNTNSSINTLYRYSAAFYKVVYGQFPDFYNGPIEPPLGASICDYPPVHNTVNEDDVTEAIKKLNEAHRKVSARAGVQTLKKKGVFYHLVNAPVDGLKGEAQLIEDKLFLLKQKTGINFYVVFQRVNTIMSQDARNLFAEQVLKGSNLADDGHTVLITVPFMSLRRLFSHVPCVQPGFAQSEGQNIVDNLDLANADNLFDYVMAAFKQIEKPVYLVRYFESVTGELLSMEYKAEHKKGLGWINAVQFYRSKYAIELAEIQREKFDLISQVESEKVDSLLIRIFNKNIKKVLNDGTIAESQAGFDVESNVWVQKSAVVSENVGLFREPYMTNTDLLNQFIEKSSQDWAYGVQFDIVFNTENPNVQHLTTQHFYDIDNFTLIDPVVYGLIDIAGLIPVIDNYVDGAGLLYAGYRDHDREAMLYSAALALPMAGAAYFKLGDELYGVVAKLDKAGDISYGIKPLKTEIAADEFQLTSVISREKDVAAQSLAAIKNQGHDAHFKALIIAKGEVGNLTTALIKKFDGFGNLQTWVKNLDEIGDAKLLAKLDDLDASYFEAIDADLANTSFKNAIEKNAELVGSWKRLFKASIKTRTNIDILADVINWPKSWNLNIIGNTVEVLQSAGKKIATITETTIIAPARTLRGIQGNPLLNRVPLVKNAIYDVDGILYYTDEFGRVHKTSTDLDDVVRIRLGNQQIRAVDVKDGVRGTDQGGHIIGARFFGPGEQINLYPQSATLNQGAWKQMENTWADAMVNGKDVKVEVEAVFSGSSKRPDAFEVSYWINGNKTKRTFINE